MSRHQLRAARALLLLRQELLADLADVGVASIRRFENGRDVDEQVVEALRIALEAEGAVLVHPGSAIGGRRVGFGVALRPDRDLPASTRERLAALDATPEQAEGLSRSRVGRPGKRARIRYPPDPGSATGRRRDRLGTEEPGED